MGSTHPTGMHSWYEITDEMFLVHMDFHSCCTKSQHKISFAGKSFDGDVVTCHCGEDLLHCGKAIFLPSGTPIFELLVMYSLDFKTIINILILFGLFVMGYSDSSLRVTLANLLVTSMAAKPFINICFFFQVVAGVKSLAQCVTILSFK